MRSPGLESRALLVHAMLQKDTSRGLRQQKMGVRGNSKCATVTSFSCSCSRSNAYWQFYHVCCRIRGSFPIHERICLQNKLPCTRASPERQACQTECHKMALLIMLLLTARHLAGYYLVPCTTCTWSISDKSVQSPE